MKEIIVTTSWDDGHALDVKLAELLRKYKLRGTFYVSPKNKEVEPDKRIKEVMIKELARDFEIGAHTLNHPRLSLLDDAMARLEINGSKQYLEELLAGKIKCFCYPGGDFKENHKDMVKEAGFLMARTIERFKTKKAGDSYAVGTTIHAYRHWSDILNIIKNVGIFKFVRCYLNWDELAIDLFDKVMSEGGVYHVWGHSWEIEKNDDWERLEKVFKYISGRKEVLYVSNGEIV